MSNNPSISGNPPPRHFTGISAVPGLVYGPVWVLHVKDESVPERIIATAEIDAELSRFNDAISATRRQILELEEMVAHGIGSGEAGMFDAHLMVVDDPFFKRTGREIGDCAVVVRRTGGAACLQRV